MTGETDFVGGGIKYSATGVGVTERCCSRSWRQAAAGPGMARLSVHEAGHDGDLVTKLVVGPAVLLFDEVRSHLGRAYSVHDSR